MASNPDGARRGSISFLSGEDFEAQEPAQDANEEQTLATQTQVGEQQDNPTSAFLPESTGSSGYDIMPGEQDPQEQAPEATDGQDEGGDDLAGRLPQFGSRAGQDFFGAAHFTFGSFPAQGVSDTSDSLSEIEGQHQGLSLADQTQPWEKHERRQAYESEPIPMYAWWDNVKQTHLRGRTARAGQQRDERDREMSPSPLNPNRLSLLRGRSESDLRSQFALDEERGPTRPSLVSSPTESAPLFPRRESRRSWADEDEDEDDESWVSNALSEVSNLPSPLPSQRAETIGSAGWGENDNLAQARETLPDAQQEPEQEPPISVEEAALILGLSAPPTEDPANKMPDAATSDVSPVEQEVNTSSSPLVVNLPAPTPGAFDDLPPSASTELCPPLAEPSSRPIDYPSNLLNDRREPHGFDESVGRPQVRLPRYRHSATQTDGQPPPADEEEEDLPSPSSAETLEAMTGMSLEAGREALQRSRARLDSNDPSDAAWRLQMKRSYMIWERDVEDQLARQYGLPARGPIPGLRINLEEQYELLRNVAHGYREERDRSRADGNAIIEQRDEILEQRDEALDSRDELMEDRALLFEERTQIQSEAKEVREERDWLQSDAKRNTEERDAAQSERNRVVVERDKVVAERDKMAAERDKVIAERDKVVAERDQMTAERDKMVAEHDKTATERDDMRAKHDQMSISLEKCHEDGRALRMEMDKLRDEHLKATGQGGEAIETTQPNNNEGDCEVRLAQCKGLLERAQTEVKRLQNERQDDKHNSEAECKQRLAEEKARLQTENERLTLELATLRQSSTAADDRAKQAAAEAEKQVKQAENRIPPRTSQDMARLQSDNDRLTLELASLTQSSTTAANKAEEAATEAEKQFKDAENKLKDAKKQLNETEKRLKDAEKQLNDTENRIPPRTSRDMTQLRSESQILTRENQRLTRELDAQKRASARELANAREVADETEKKSKEEIASLRTASMMMQSDLHQVADNSGLQARLRAREQEFITAKKDMDASVNNIVSQRDFLLRVKNLESEQLELRTLRYREALVRAIRMYNRDRGQMKAKLAYAEEREKLWRGRAFGWVPSDLEDQLDKCRAHGEELAGEIADLKQQLRERTKPNTPDAETSDLQRQLDECRAEKEKLTERSVELRKQVQGLKSESGSLVGKAQGQPDAKKSIQGTQSEPDAEKVDLKHHLAQCRARGEGLNQEITDLERRLEVLDREKSNLQRQLTECRAHGKGTNQEIADLKQRIELLGDEKYELKRQLAEYSAHGKDFNQNVTDLKQQLMALDSEKSDLQRQLARCRLHRERRDGEMKALGRQIKAMDLWIDQKISNGVQESVEDAELIQGITSSQTLDDDATAQQRRELQRRELERQIQALEKELSLREDNRRQVTSLEGQVESLTAQVAAAYKACEAQGNETTLAPESRGLAAGTPAAFPLSLNNLTLHTSHVTSAGPPAPAVPPISVSHTLLPPRTQGWEAHERIFRNTEAYRMTMAFFEGQTRAREEAERARDRVILNSYANAMGEPWMPAYNRRMGTRLGVEVMG